MRFYTTQHRYSCGIDLHARTMYVCILNQDGGIVFHRNLPSTPDSFLKAIAPYRDDLGSLSSASSPGTGWLISAPARGSPSSSGTRST